jgi:hypothetical protein
VRRRPVGVDTAADHAPARFDRAERHGIDGADVLVNLDELLS